MKKNVVIIILVVVIIVLGYMLMVSFPKKAAWPSFKKDAAVKNEPNAAAT